MYFSDYYDRVVDTKPTVDTKKYSAMPTFPPKSEEDFKKIAEKDSAIDLEKYVYLCQYCKIPADRDMDTYWGDWFHCKKCKIHTTVASLTKMLKADWGELSKSSNIQTQSPNKTDSKIETIKKSGVVNICITCDSQLEQDPSDPNWFKCVSCNLIKHKNYTKQRTVIYKEDIQDYKHYKCGLETVKKDEKWRFCNKCKESIHIEWFKFYNEASAKLIEKANNKL